MKTFVLLSMLAIVFSSATAEVIWSDDFDSRTSILEDANPVFKTEVGTNTWVAGGADWSIVDIGGGDKVVRRTAYSASTGLALWLDVGELGLVGGNTYTLQFTVANYTLSGAGALPNNFANVVRATGIDDGTGSVTLDLLRGANFDPQISTDALIGTGGGALTETSIYVSTAGSGATYWSGNGTFAKEFSIASSDEYIGLIIAAQDVNGQQVAFDLQSVSVIPEPATFGLVGAMGVVLLFIRRRLTI